MGVKLRYSMAVPPTPGTCHLSRCFPEVFKLISLFSLTNTENTGLILLRITGSPPPQIQLYFVDSDHAGGQQGAHGDADVGQQGFSSPTSTSLRNTFEMSLI